MRRKNIFIFVLLVVFLGSHSAYAGSQKRIKVQSVTIQGNSAFSARTIKKAMVTRPSKFFSRKYYYPEVLEADGDHIEDLYRSNGYLDAAIKDKEVIIDRKKNSAKISITISEGEIYRIESISIFGNDIFSDEQLRQKLKIAVHDPLKRAKIQQSNTEILSLYANNGYLDAEINADIHTDRDTHMVSVDFVIKENNPYTISDILINGLEKTKPGVVQRELLFKAGEVVDYSKLLDTQRALYLTGLFQSVFISPKQPRSGNLTMKDVSVDVHENPSIEFGASAGYDTIDKFWQQAEIANINLSGKAQKVGLQARRSSNMYRIESSFTELWTFRTRWRTDLNIFNRFREEPGFDVIRTGCHLAIGRTLSRNINVSFAYRHENVTLENIRVSALESALSDNIDDFIVSLVRDTRDSLLMPRKGKYMEWTNEFIFTKISFIRSLYHLKFFHPLNRSLIAASAVEFGVIGTKEKAARIPLQERFYTGGPNSVRGFEYNMVGPLDENNLPVGGQLKVVLHLFEFRQYFSDVVSMALFSDTGNVWRKASDFNLSDFRTSVGTGLRVATVIGLFRCDYGFNIKPKESEAKGQFYFGTGLAF